MNNRIHCISAAIALAFSVQAIADDHDEGEGYNLAIHHVHAKLDRIPQFQAGMEAYSDCLAENEGKDGYSVWRNVNGDRSGFHIVDRFDSWAEMDEDDPAGDACWGREEIRAGVFDNMSSWKTSYAAKMPEWSGDADGYTVVHLHNFRVSDGEAFRSVIGEIMGHVAEADYEHHPDWFNVMPGGYWEADFFAVAHFADFAAMDEDRPGVRGVLNQQVGEERGEELWDAWGDAMSDEKGYWRDTLVLQPSMGYAPDD